MQPLSSAQIAEIVASASKPHNVTIYGISTDSRTCGAKDVFIALVGDRFDGHDFAAAVEARGCPLMIVNRLLDSIPPEKQIVVEDTLKAYGLLGAYNRSLFKGIVIGLTGSAGKTTTKEELKFVLSKFGRVYATSENHNNAVGVPETLCGLDMSADYAVIEMGMSSQGEIATLVSYVQPDVAIVTNVYPMHIEFFDSLQAIAEAKSEIFGGLKKGGVAILNADTAYADILEKAAQVRAGKVVKFGQDYPVPYFETAQIGEHFEANARCVLTTLGAIGLDVTQAAQYIKDFGALPGRGKHHHLCLPNGGNYTLIDDSYSGQPDSMKLALTVLDKMTLTGRKIAVLGKMAELGKHSREEHISIGQFLAETSIDIVVGVCPEMKDMLLQLPVRMKQYYFEDINGLDIFLTEELLKDGDAVLMKGAHYSSKLYQVAAALIEKGNK